MENTRSNHNVRIAYLGSMPAQSSSSQLKRKKSKKNTVKMLHGCQEASLLFATVFVKPLHNCCILSKWHLNSEWAALW